MHRHKTKEPDRWWRNESGSIRDFWDGVGVARKAPRFPIAVLLYDGLLTRFSGVDGLWRYRCDAIASQFRNQPNPPGTYKTADSPNDAIEAVEAVFYRQIAGTRLVRPRSLIFIDNELQRDDDGVGTPIHMHIGR